MPQQLNEPDPFADALEYYERTGRSALYYTREDGVRRRDFVGWYFASYPDFWRIEKPALKFARGRVLDVGCGAGRMSLYLQRQGLRVTGIDSSPRVAAIASARGVRDVRVALACKRLPFSRGQFDTILLFGNNLGICGTRARTAQLLRELARVSKRGARILGTTISPGACDRKTRDYWNWKLARGDKMGEAQMTLDFMGRNSRTVEWFWSAPDRLVELAWENGWRVAEIFEDGRAEKGYAVVFEKLERSTKEA